MSLYNPAHVHQQRAKVHAAGERDADPAATAMVRCRGCNALVPIRLAVSLEDALARAGRRREGGSAWACRPCVAAARESR